MRHILLIGMGAVGRHVARALQNEANRVRLSILVRSQYVKEVKARVDEVIFDAEHFFDGYRSAPDYALACLRAASEAGATLLHDDADFDVLARHTPLRIEPVAS